MPTEPRTGVPISRQEEPAKELRQRPLPHTVTGLNSRDHALQKDSAPDGTLIVGKAIRFKGDISACDCLVVEGEVEASLVAQRLVVAKDGRFQGTAKVANAEVAGSFVGNLDVTDKLLIRGTGRVAGGCRYARISIEDGGVITGDVNAKSGHLESLSLETPQQKTANS
jgi:cytoskeletal protein CcmA (bactofilin family)